MKSKYSVLNNAQLADELAKYANGEVQETPQNVKAFDILIDEVINRLRNGGNNAYNRKKLDVRRKFRRHSEISRN